MNIISPLGLFCALALKVLGLIVFEWGPLDYSTVSQWVLGLHCFSREKSMLVN